MFIAYLRNKMTSSCAFAIMLLVLDRIPLPCEFKAAIQTLTSGASNAANDVLYKLYTKMAA